MLNNANKNNSEMNYLFQLKNESKEQTNQESEYIDLTQDDDSSEDEKEINKSNYLLLGNKTQRPNDNNKNSNNKNDNKKLTLNNSVYIDVNEEPSYILSSNANFYNANNNTNINNNNDKEREELLRLVKIDGFNKIFNLITKPQFDQSNPVEKKLEEIIFKIGLLTTSLILLQIKFTFSPVTLPNPHPKDDVMKKKREMQLIDLEKKGYNLSEHLHKDKNGKIYKYMKHHLRIKNIYVYNCYDKICKSKGLYDAKNMNFKIIYEHTIPHEKHNYIYNKNKYEQLKGIFEDFNKKNCLEAQIFKNEDGDKLVKWYNNC